MGFTSLVKSLESPFYENSLAVQIRMVVSSFNNEYAGQSDSKRREIIVVVK